MTRHNHMLSSRAAGPIADDRTHFSSRLRLFAVCSAVAVSCLGVLTGSASAAPGDLDPSFGTGGTAVTDVTPGQTDRARGVAVQADGKILAVDTGSKLVRFNRDGSLDTTFDGDGKVDTVIQGVSVAVQSDGKIVIAGTNGRFAVARYNDDGSLDTSFGTGGTNSTDFQICQIGECATNGIAERVVIQPDGAIVVAGELTQTVFGSDFRYVGVARYAPDGSTDTPFGDAGKNFVTVDTGASGVGLALQDDGKIVVATGKGGDFFLARFLGPGPSAGALDPDFGTAGSTSADIGGSDAATDVAVQGNTIVAVGGAGTGANVDFALARFRVADGGLDASFGTGGRVTTDVGAQDFANAIELQDDGKLVLAGQSRSTALGDPADFALARYAPNGSLDPSFGGDGKVTTSIGPGADVAYDLAIQPGDGKIIAAGSMIGAAEEDMALARYEAFSANLSLTAGDAPDPVTVGESLTYTLTVSNRGPDSARAVRLTDSLSTRVGYQSSSSSQGSCSPSDTARSVSCALGDLASGASATVRIVVKPTRTGTAVNSASVTGARQDPDEADNVVRSTTTIALPAPGAPAGPAVPVPAAPAAGKATAKLEVARARVSRSSRRLDVLAPISKLASGDVRVEFFAAGQRARFSEHIDSGKGQIRLSRVISRAQAAAGTGILTISYAGDSDTRAQEVRLRAASQHAALKLSRPQIVNGHLRASGTVTARARGVVRVQIEYVADAKTETLELTAPIRAGRWKLDEALSQSVRDAIARRTGSVHSYTLFTGYLPPRIRGEMQSYQILGDR